MQTTSHKLTRHPFVPDVVVVSEGMVFRSVDDSGLIEFLAVVSTGAWLGVVALVIVVGVAVEVFVELAVVVEVVTVVVLTVVASLTGGCGPSGTSFTINFCAVGSTPVIV